MQKTLSGHRCKVYIGDSTGANPPRLVGIFNNVSWGLQLDAQAVFILGRTGPAEIAYTGQEPVGITCSGWRVVDHGPHADGRVPKLADLIRHEYLEFTIVDRQTGTRVAVIHGVRPTGYTMSLTERQLATMSSTYMGLVVSDESADNEESADAADLP